MAPLGSARPDRIHPPPDEEIGQIDGALRAWRQGDAVLGPDLLFVHVADLDRPLTTVALDRKDEMSGKGEELGLEAVASGVEGVVVTTQTCDVVRSAKDRPYVKVAPLVRVDAQALGMVRKGLLPAYAYIPSVADLGFVADLDRTMTVEKAVVACWRRVRGCSTDEEARLVTQAGHPGPRAAARRTAGSARSRSGGRRG